MAFTCMNLVIIQMVRLKYAMIINVNVICDYITQTRDIRTDNLKGGVLNFVLDLNKLI